MRRKATLARESIRRLVIIDPKFKMAITKTAFLALALNALLVLAAASLWVGVQMSTSRDWLAYLFIFLVPVVCLLLVAMIVRAMWAKPADDATSRTAVGD